MKGSNFISVKDIFEGLRFFDLHFSKQDCIIGKLKMYNFIRSAWHIESFDMSHVLSLVMVLPNASTTMMRSVRWDEVSLSQSAGAFKLSARGIIIQHGKGWCRDAASYNSYPLIWKSEFLPYQIYELPWESIKGLVDTILSRICLSLMNFFMLVWYNVG